MCKQTPIYPYSFAEAQRNGDHDIRLYRESHRANIDCTKAIEKAISENFDGMHLKSSATKGVILEYGIDRVMLLLANTLQKLEYDGRFSNSNKAWGNSVILPFSFSVNNRGADYIINSHPAVLDGFIDMVRQEYKALNLWENAHCIPPDNIDFENKVMVLKPEVLKDKYKTPDFQLFYAQSGFGCSPTARGKQVYGRFLADGEHTHFERSRFIGQLKPELVPDWAKEKAKEFQKGWTLRDCYIDDGYTGTNFDRPDFKRMLHDAETGKIDCIITKDLPYYTIEGKQYPAELVRINYRQITYGKLEAFLIEYGKIYRKIGNTKAYLITALYNIPLTADAALSNRVNHDMYGGNKY